MRECIYCGKSLEKDEKCNCAMSVAKRMEKNQAAGQSSHDGQKKTKKDSKDEKRAEKEKQKAEKERRKQEAKRSRASAGYTHSTGRNIFLDMWNVIKMFLRSPIETIMNPVGVNKSEVLFLAGFEGLISGLCMFSVITGASRGSLRFIGGLLGFKGIEGYNAVMGWIMSAAAGIIGGIGMFLLYTAVFYAISRWIFRFFTTYWDFAKRLVFATLPLTLIGTLGVVLGIFSQTTFIVLLLCGLAGSVAVTYEVLRAMWSSKSAAASLYGMMAGIYIFLLFAMYIVRLCMI